jgi:hypothetical protein
MFKFLKNLFSFSPANDLEASSSIQKLVSLNALNRRKNTRVKYPHFGGFGPYPKIYYMDSEIIVGNISVGGILIIDDTEKFGDEIGAVVTIEMVWSDYRTKARARLVGANMQRRHLQFVDFNANAFTKISQLLRPGYLGSRFRIVHDELGKLQAHEMWLGPTSESLVFTKTNSFAEISVGNEKVSISRNRPSYLVSTNQKISYQLLCDILVIIANIPEPTPRVKELLEIIEIELKASETRKTG